MRIIIVGAGLFGRVAGHLAQAEGHEVVWIDSRKPGAGSPPAGGLMKPSWMTSLGPKAKIGLGVLDRLYTLQQREFTLPLGIKTDAHFVHPNTILDTRPGEQVITGNVRAIRPSGREVVLADGEVVAGDVTLVAAGIWTRELVPNIPPVRALTGAAFLFKGEVAEPFIRPWAPYKQLVGFVREMGLTWVGDGTAILHHNYNEARERASLVRAQQALNTDAAPLAVLRGSRPYVEGHKHGYFQRISSRLFVSTGGAKNGTVLAGAHAHDFETALAGL